MQPKFINLALQGGGAHGAFTWGVLDTILEDERIEIEAISGTSAGAMNAAVLADGMMKGGREGGRRALEAFWAAVSRAALSSPLKRSVWDMLTGNWNLDFSPSYLFFDQLSRVASPYQINPLNLNPLRDLVLRQVNFERLHRCDCIKLFISATSVRTGKVKVFQHAELTVDALMASACLPLLFQAVEIDGEAYWDGGYMGNPVLFPFFYRCRNPDIVIVQINPIEYQGTPMTAPEIMDRVNVIAFNSSLMSEFRAIDFVARLLDQGALDAKRYKRVLLHIIYADQRIGGLTASSKFNAEWAFLQHLHELGRAAASEWLDRHFESIGERSTVNVRSLFT